MDVLVVGAGLGGSPAARAGGGRRDRRGRWPPGPDRAGVTCSGPGEWASRGIVARPASRRVPDG